MDKAKFNMFDTVKDNVSGLKGKILGITFYDTGCIHYGIAQTKLRKDGTLHEWTFLDESRLTLISKAVKAKTKKPRSGPDMNPRMY